MELKNKVVLITGGNNGLGLSTAKALLKEGAVVHTVSRDEQKQNEVRVELNDVNFYTHKGDITNYKEVESVVSEIGNIDILINNAGVWIEGVVNINSPEEISRAIDVNTKGVIFTVKAVLPQMLKKDDGYIFNISSTSGLKARANESVYVASKMAVTGFTDSLKEDLKQTNIKVAGFYPGGMSTEFFKKGGSPKDNAGWMDTDKVAGVIVTILKLDDSMIMDHVVLSRRKVK
jgi:NADP-dependent 3-hydroxy acid dehydrogenase YdfG